jgi:hypothetical protein
MTIKSLIENFKELIQLIALVSLITFELIILIGGMILGFDKIPDTLWAAFNQILGAIIVVISIKGADVLHSKTQVITADDNNIDIDPNTCSIEEKKEV